MSLIANVVSSAPAEHTITASPGFGIVRLANLLLSVQSLGEATSLPGEKRVRRNRKRVNSEDDGSSADNESSGDESTIAGASSDNTSEVVSSRDALSEICSSIDAMSEADDSLSCADPQDLILVEHERCLEVSQRIANALHLEFSDDDSEFEDEHDSYPGNYGEVSKKIAGVFESELRAVEKAEEIEQWQEVCQRMTSSRIWEAASDSEDECFGQDIPPKTAAREPIELEQWQGVCGILASSKIWDDVVSDDEDMF